MPKLADRVKETGTVTGTDAITLSGAVAGYRAFSAAFAAGDHVWYAVQTADGTTWEVGRGVLLNSTTLSRAQVYTSSNSGNPVNFAAATAVQVFNTLAADHAENSNIGIQTARMMGAVMP